MKTGSEFHVGIVGLGSMGMGAALSCVRAGLSTWGADLNSNACATLKEAGACGVSDNAATFAEKLDALLVLVVNAAQVKQVLFGETGVAQHLKPGTAVMVSSTIASADAQEIATALAGFDLEMLDAPVSGGAVKAANGEMTVMASGSDIAFERLAPVLFENRMRHVVDGDYTPHSAVDIFVKDLGLVADTAKALHFPLPLASTALNMFTSASNAGYGKEDDSAVIKIFSGITLPGAKS
ncbi:TPA: NAD(P)-dependent oxidoreductase [Escherichia coli]